MRQSKIQSLQGRYNMSIQVSVSMLCADFKYLAKEVSRCEDAGVDLLHIDVMDGHFVPNITIGALVVEALRPITQLPIEAHLMVEHPGMFIQDFLDAGADSISLHAECYAKSGRLSVASDGYTRKTDALDLDKVRQDINLIRAQDKRVFIVLNPETPLCLEPILKDIDGVLIMSVNPGFAKQKFMQSVLPKIKHLREMFEGDIAVDGGINEKTAPEVVRAGANILATASYFFGSNDPAQSVQYLKNLKGA